MTRVQHLLCILMEECAEVAHRASKALRFGMDEIQPGQPLTNAERITQEYADLVAVLLMLKRECPQIDGVTNEMLDAKRLKVEKFLKYSEECGTLQDEAPHPAQPSPGAQPTEQDMARAREMHWSGVEDRVNVIAAALQRERRETAQRCVDIGPRLMFASPESKWEASCNDAFKIYASEIRRAEGLE